MNNRISNATRWSFLTQLFSKIVAPITNMILARILAPEVFGIIATITMITSFADLLTESGFQQYLIQKEFSDKNAIKNCANIAFFINFCISSFLLLLIFINRVHLAKIFGDVTIYNALFVASLQLPITSISSVQMTLFKRNLNFKPIFYSQTISSLVPLIITVPLALLGLGYWSVIIGNLFGTVLRAVILSVLSSYKLKFYFNLNEFKDMIQFSFFALLESLSSWLVNWADTFFIGILFTPYYLGLYKNSISMVNSLIAIITSAFLPVLYSVLSRYQNDNCKYNAFLMDFHRFISYMVLPIGTGVLIFDKYCTLLLFGSKWIEASFIVGYWAFSTIIRTLFFSIFTEAFRSIGKPVICLLLQLLDFCIMVFIFLIFSNIDFHSFVILRCVSRLIVIGPSIILLNRYYHIRPMHIVMNIIVPIIGCVVMVFIKETFVLLHVSFFNNIFGIFICAFVYTIFIFIFARKDVFKLIHEFVL
ncbi:MULTISPECIES: oligosaccharide flippase family protein [Coprobacillaceae]|uniref:oligosaccharide flippase family protein n=1 Tax=Coprobacillaceae TaxID=2810280 RepID=UPI000E4F9AD2|nr:MULTISPECIES: oligosaccharide flippase family protein [Coprobacillaceae]RHM62808.1 hypothetical protein DWZ53_01935 [Coprobacillus sp. AF33-1AC]RHS96105.1 hypothetical protein DW911_01875 [Erysipelatoclostridium sp. AM42-17]